MNLLDGLQVEIKRVTGMIEIYRKFPTAQFTAQLMQIDVDTAIEAMAKNDMAGMVISCEALRSWTSV